MFWYHQFVRQVFKSSTWSLGELQHQVLPSKFSSSYEILKGINLIAFGTFWASQYQPTYLLNVYRLLLIWSLVGSTHLCTWSFSFPGLISVYLLLDFWCFCLYWVYWYCWSYYSSFISLALVVGNVSTTVQANYHPVKS